MDGVEVGPALLPDTLSAEEVRQGLDTAFIGQTVFYWPSVDSTNEEARRLAGLGAPEGTLVLADHQTAGRGRLGRRWEAPPGSSLLISVILRPHLGAPQIHRLTMIAGLAMAEAIEAETGLWVALKWPNDLLIGEAKVGGVLAEAALVGDRVEYAVVGLGLNVNLDPTQLPGPLLAAASSLSQALGRRVARRPLLQAFLRALERRYQQLQAGILPHREWAGRLTMLGRPVIVTVGEEVLEGVAEGVDGDGALLVRLADGSLRLVVAGDVTSVRKQRDPAS